MQALKALQSAISAEDAQKRTEKEVRRLMCMCLLDELAVACQDTPPSLACISK